MSRQPDHHLLDQPMRAHSRGFFIGMTVELLIHGIIAYCLTQSGWPLWQALILNICIWIGLRMLMVLGNFIQTEKAKSPRPVEWQINAMQAWVMYCRECWAAIATYPFYFALERRVSNRPRGKLAHNGPPIILVPGFLCNRGYWGKFRRFLERQGFGQVYTVTLEPIFAGIDPTGEHLGEFVEAVCEETGKDQVILIGHSMGGISIRCFMHQVDKNNRVAKAISLGTPYSGTILAIGPRKLGPTLQQMTPKSDWSQALNQVEEQPAPAPVYSIWSPHDSIVSPQDSSEISDTYGKNIVMPGVGHMEMVVNRDLMKKVVDIIRN